MDGGLDQAYSGAALVAQQFIDRSLGARAFIDSLDDAGTMGRRLARPGATRARDNHRIGRHAALEYFAGVEVDDLGRLADEYTHRDDRAFADDDAFGDFGTHADEAIVLDDGRRGLQWFEHAADARATGDVAMLADLGTGANRRPAVDHGAFVDIGADIDEAWHQDDVFCDEGWFAHDGARHGAEAGGFEFPFAPAGEFGVDLVPPGCIARRTFDELRRVQAKGKEHGLLQPLMHVPLAGDFFGDAQLAAIQTGERAVDRLADRAFGVGAERVLLVPCLFDDVCKAHGV